MKPVADLIRSYREKGFKITPQRVAIFKLLENNKSHPSAEGIFKQLQTEYPTISFTTVYNTLKSLKDLGEIIELNISADRKHFDPDISPHHHAICNDCGHVIDILGPDLASLPTLEAFECSGFRPDSFHVEIRGKCSSCADLN